MTRTFFGVGWLIAGWLIASSVTSTAQQKNPERGPDGVDPNMPFFLTCAKECDACTRSCELCVSHCSQMLGEGKKEALVTLRVCQDCSAICAAASRIVVKDGPCADLICVGCAEACNRCAVACEKSGDSIVKKCAEDCRKCEKACREMAKPERKPEKS